MKDLQITSVKLSDKSFVDFMNEWGEDVENIFPHFDEEDIFLGDVLMLHMNNKNIGVFITQNKGEELHVIVDYVIPEYRDIGIGESLFEKKIEEYRKIGFSAVVSLTSDEKHKKYLGRCGFVHLTKHADWYEISLK